MSIQTTFMTNWAKMAPGIACYEVPLEHEHFCAPIHFGRVRWGGGGAPCPIRDPVGFGWWGGFHHPDPGWITSLSHITTPSRSLPSPLSNTR